MHNIARNGNKINWEWVLENMRYCPKCNNYKLLENFEGKKEKCKNCAFTFKKKIISKPEPIMLENESEVHQNINQGLTGSTKIKLKLTLKQKDLNC